MKPKETEDNQPPERDERFEKVGARIKKLRKGKGSIEKFAYEAGFSRSQAWRLEQGEDFKMSTLFRIVDGLGISLSDFFKEDL